MEAFFEEIDSMVDQSKEFFRNNDKIPSVKNETLEAETTVEKQERGKDHEVVETERKLDISFKCQFCWKHISDISSSTQVSLRHISH